MRRLEGAGLEVQRALQKAMHMSYMALEVCDDANKADWCVHTCRRYKLRLNQEAEWVKGIYMDLTPRTKREARTWLVGAHNDLEHARDHIGTRQNLRVKFQ